MLILKDLGPDGRLPPERELALKFGVSRVTIRQALNALQSAGLVTSHVGRGTFAIKTGYAAMIEQMPSLFTDRETVVAEPMEVRRILEPPTARLAAQRASAAEIRAMADCLEAQIAKVARSEPIIAEDHRFHSLVSEASHNLILAQIVQSFNAIMQSARNRWSMAYVNETSIAGHQRILEAIRNRDPDGAERAMLDHLEAVESALLNRMISR